MCPVNNDYPEPDYILGYDKYVVEIPADTSIRKLMVYFYKEYDKTRVFHANDWLADTPGEQTIVDDIVGPRKLSWTVPKGARYAVCVVSTDRYADFEVI